MNAINDLFGTALKFVNIGAPNFAEDLKLQGQSVIQLAWQPPAMDASLLEVLDELMDDDAVQAANEEAVRRIMSSQTRLVGLARAPDVIPGMTNDTMLHAGPVHGGTCAALCKAPSWARSCTKAGVAEGQRAGWRQAAS